MYEFLHHFLGVAVQLYRDPNALFIISYVNLYSGIFLVNMHALVVDIAVLLVFIYCVDMIRFVC